MSHKVKLRLTFTYDYEADPQHYDTDDIAKMCAIDAEGIADFFPDVLGCGQGVVVVEPRQ